MRQPYTFLKDDGPGKRKKKAIRQEKRWAEKVKGRRQPASGALWGAKGDVRERSTGVLDGFCWDNKQTKNKSFRLKIEDWEKIRQEAIKQGNSPGLHIEFTSSPSSAKPLRLVVLEEGDFLYLKDLAEKTKAEKESGYE